MSFSVVLSYLRLFLIIFLNFCIVLNGLEVIFLVREGEILDVIKDCDECIRELSYLTVWKLKNGQYAICSLTSSGYFKVFQIHSTFEHAINNALWYDLIL